MDGSEWLLGLAVGVGLAAACGFRVFVPLLVMSVAARSGHLTLASNFDWLASGPTMVALGMATLMEVGAYYVPWLDNLLDGIATPAAIVAGTVASASVLTGMDPLLQWSIALIAGGGAAGTVQLTTVAARAASSLTTGGLGNPVVSSAEAGLSTALAVLSVIAPLIVVTLLVVAVIGVARLFRRRRVARV